MIRGNRQGKAGSLIPYQCGEAVVNGKGEMPEGIGGDTEDLPLEVPA